MYKQFRIFLLLLLIGLLEQSTLSAQLKINNIFIEGNAKTKSYIILRELPYKIGSIISKDSLSILNKIAETQLVNSALFVEVKVETKQVAAEQADTNLMDVYIHVKERWYFFPVPILKLVDRNFNQWWVQQNHSLDRVNYGLNFYQSNTTGNNDRLIVGVVSGYTHQLILRYQFPFIDKKLRFGAGIGFQQYSQKEINNSTLGDKQVFFKNEEVNKQGYRANVNISYRPGLYERHTLQIGVGQENISDSVLLLTPHYLPNYKKTMNYMDLTLSYSKIHFNYNAYPSEGNSTELGLAQRFSENSFYTSLQLRKIKAHSFSPTNFIFLESNTVLKILPNQNYADQRLLGYANMQMNGLEYYVVDGNAGSIAKCSFNHLLGSYSFSNYYHLKFFPEEIKYLFWLKAFTNLGYVYSEHPTNPNKLNNTLLRTAGIGLDIIGIYDFVLKIDFSVNQLGDKGLYLHGGINF